MSLFPSVKSYYLTCINLLKFSLSPKLISHRLQCIDVFISYLWHLRTQAQARSQFWFGSSTVETFISSSFECSSFLFRCRFCYRQTIAISVATKCFFTPLGAVSEFAWLPIRSMLWAATMCYIFPITHLSPLILVTFRSWISASERATYDGIYISLNVQQASTPCRGKSKLVVRSTISLLYSTLKLNTYWRLLIKKEPSVRLM